MSSCSYIRPGRSAGCHSGLQCELPSLGAPGLSGASCISRKGTFSLCVTSQDTKAYVARVPVVILQVLVICSYCDD